MNNKNYGHNPFLGDFGKVKGLETILKQRLFIQAFARQQNYLCFGYRLQILPDLNGFAPTEIN